MFEIMHATKESHFNAVRVLIKEYVGWHYQRHASYRDMIDRYFDQSTLPAELQGLPGAFATPCGRLLLGFDDGNAIGTVALRNLGRGVCEMKRLYVAPAARGLGLGRALAHRLIGEARSIGYRAMRLDSGPLQHEAHALYRSLGFVKIGPYNPLDAQMRDWLLFFERDLGAPLPKAAVDETATV